MFLHFMIQGRISLLVMVRYIIVDLVREASFTLMEHEVT